MDDVCAHRAAIVSGDLLAIQACLQSYPESLNKVRSWGLVVGCALAFVGQEEEDLTFGRACSM